MKGKADWMTPHQSFLGAGDTLGVASLPPQRHGAHVLAQHKFSVNDEHDSVESLNFV